MEWSYQCGRRRNLKHQKTKNKLTELLAELQKSDSEDDQGDRMRSIEQQLDQI